MNVTQFVDDTVIYVSAKATTDIEKQLKFDLVSISAYHEINVSLLI